MLLSQWCWFSRSVMSDSVQPYGQGSSVHGVFQARILEWVVFSFSSGTSWPRDQTQVSCIAGNLLHCRQILYWLSHHYHSNNRTNLDSVLRSKDITLPTKSIIVKAMVFPVVMHGCESWTIKKAGMLKNWEDSWKSLGLQGDPTSPSFRISTLNILWKDWCWSWSSNT